MFFFFFLICEAIRSFTSVTCEGKLKFQLKWNMLNFILGNLWLIDIFNCNWIVTWWQYTFTHEQYIQQHK